MLAVSACALAFFGVAGHSRFSGPTVLSVTRSHGLHLDDLVVIGFWVVAMLCCKALWDRQPPR